jgi:hypothetical protein
LINPDVINITLAMFHAPEEIVDAATQLIVYNFEQIGAPATIPIRQTYFRIMRKAFVWDYSAAHLHTLRAAGIEHVAHVPLGDAEEWLYVDDATRDATRPVIEEDVDILFYGALQDRRTRIIDELRTRNINVRFPNGDEESRDIGRQRLIARAKLLLNIGGYDAMNTLEMVRIAPWLAMGKAVVTELRADTIWDRSLAGAFAGVPYQSIVETCVTLLANPEQRRALGINAKKIFAQHRFDDSVKQGISAYLETRARYAPQRVLSGSVTTPKKLRYSLGKSWAAAALNVSPDVNDDPDIVINLSQPLVPNARRTSWRFGDVTLRENAFTSIESDQPFQTLAQVYTFLQNANALLIVDGSVRVTLPYAGRRPKDQTAADQLTVDEQTFSMWPQQPDLNGGGLTLRSVTHVVNVSDLPSHYNGSATPQQAIECGAVQSLTFEFVKRK